MNRQAYLDFLRAKVQFDKSCGFDVDPAEVNPLLKPHQRDQFTMPEETVLDPFGGLMTVPYYCAVKLKRKGIGIELSERYWSDGAWGTYARRKSR